MRTLGILLLVVIVVLAAICIAYPGLSSIVAMPLIFLLVLGLQLVPRALHYVFAGFFLGIGWRKSRDWEAQRPSSGPSDPRNSPK